MNALGVFELIGGCLGWLTFGWLLLDGHRRRNDPAHARVRRPPGTVRLTYWHGLPGEPGSVQSRVTVEGLPPDDAARVVEHYRHIVDDDEP
jgi:hypothetical protein